MRELDFNMPLKNLFSKKLQVLKNHFFLIFLLIFFFKIIEKKFADDPMNKSTRNLNRLNQRSMYASESLFGKKNLSKILLNEIIACKHEVFIKILK